ncbi:ATP-binding protein [Sorangium sp. So ce185]|uniref:AAA family ATPase n=1 Tax=Sorangium sp. So ce185 TaxID=3133287 RepID=UPI003F632182
MRILTFEVQSARRGWTLEPMALDAFNLLVGVSGAGKTRIVRTIEQVCSVALGKKETEERLEQLRGASFAIDFEHDGLTYRWEAELEPRVGLGSEDHGALHSEEPALIRSELILEGDRPIVERAPERFLLNGHAIPKLDRAQSAIAVLKEDPAMAPLYRAFSRSVPLEALENLPSYGTQIEGHFEELRNDYQSAADVGADFTLPLHNKSEFLQELFPDAFAEIEEAFREAFPTVEKLKVQRYRYLGNERSKRWAGMYNMALTAAESGVDGMIPFADMSSGMQRYLSFLVHLSFAPPGTVVLIDELESSLGVNCLPAVTRFLLSRAPDLQFVLTSHHPYIIEQIPPSHWKIVTRKGSRVRVLDAEKIPAMAEERSHLDRFTRLINLPEYEHGVQG